MSKLLTAILLVFFCSAKLFAAAENKLTPVPLFQSCGIYFEASDMATLCVTKFRMKGSNNWNKVLELTAIPEKQLGSYSVNRGMTENLFYTDKAMFRGIIVNLQENTEYELKIIQGKNAYMTKFKTWNSTLPIAKTVNVKNLKFDRQLIITEKVIKEVNPKQRGWAEYFKIGNSYREVLKLSQYSCEQLRIYWRRHKARKKRRSYKKWSDKYFYQGGLLYVPYLIKG